MNEVEIKAKLRDWIVTRSKQPIRMEDLTDETPVVDSGMLSSLDIVEFVLYIENLRGSEVDPEDLEPSAFVSTNTIYEAFFAGEAR